MKKATTLLGLLLFFAVSVTFGREKQGGDCALELSLLAFANVSCNGASDGSLTVIGSEGTGENTYTINNGVNDPVTNTTGIFTGIPAGTYTITVTDAVGCSDVITQTINQPAAISVNATVLQHITCNGGNNGQIQVSASGGIGSQSFSLDGVNYFSNTTFGGLPAGNYTIYMKDAGGCTGSTTVTITEPAALTADALADGTTCHNGNDGSIEITAVGGTQPYSYSINQGFQYFPSGNFTNLTPGEYLIVVRDANHCMYFTSAQVVQPSIITAVIGVTQATCGSPTGSLNISGSGGNGAPYTYSIDNGTNWQSAQLFTDLLPGVYNILVQDNAGCTRNFGTAVNTTTGPEIEFLTSTNVTCHNGNDGSITVLAVSGGTGTLHYSVGGSAFTTNPNFTGLAAGDYVVAVKDAVGCVDLQLVTLTQPAAVVATAVSASTSCFGSTDGLITVNASGGSGPLTYSVNGVSYQSSNTFNVAAGPHYIWVKDAGGCIGLTTAYVQQPQPVHIVTGHVNINCHGDATGEIFVNVTGGTAPYVVALDDWNYLPQFSFTGLTGGSHTVFVKDANNCLASQHVTIAQPTLLSYTGEVSDVSCAGGNNGYVNITVTGGVQPYSFNWSNGSQSEDILHLTAGTYSVYVTDANGCTINGQTFTVEAPENPIIINGAVTNASGVDAEDGAIDITVTGGTQPYNFVWNNGAITEDITNLLPGVYGVQVNDASGCSASAGFTVAWNLSLEEDVEAVLTVYPNPASNWLKINGGEYVLNQIVIYNLSGAVIYESRPNSFVEEINLDSFANGMYLIKVQSGDHFITKKLEVVK
jgi:hypothetical protein